MPAMGTHRAASYCPSSFEYYSSLLCIFDAPCAWRQVDLDGA